MQPTRSAAVECSLLVTSNARKVDPAAGTLLIRLGAMPRNKACLEVGKRQRPITRRPQRLSHSTLPDNLCHFPSYVSQTSWSRWSCGKLDFALDHIEGVTGEPVTDSSGCARGHVCQHGSGTEWSRGLLFETSFCEFISCRVSRLAEPYDYP